MRNEKHPDRLEPIQGANTLGEQDKDSDYLSNIQTICRKTPQEFADEIGLKSVSEMLKEGGNYE